MPNRALLIGSIAGLVGLSILVLTAAGGQETFTVVATLEEEQEEDLGEKGPSIGDLYTFSGPLYDES